LTDKEIDEIHAGGQRDFFDVLRLEAALVDALELGSGSRRSRAAMERRDECRGELLLRLHPVKCPRRDLSAKTLDLGAVPARG
jgi:hypothetical protein